MSRLIFKRLLVVVLAVHTGMLGMPRMVGAAPIGAQSVIEAQSRQARIDALQAEVARDDVRDALVGLGVDPDTVESRIAALTDEELRSIDRHLEQMPAGGILEVLGVILVVLLVLELVGVTNVFSKL